MLAGRRLRALEGRTPEEDARLREFESSWAYQGEQTCAADGMCQEKCPVKINTGELVKSVRCALSPILAAEASLPCSSP